MRGQPALDYSYLRGKDIVKSRFKEALGSSFGTSALYIHSFSIFLVLTSSQVGFLTNQTQNVMCKCELHLRINFCFRKF